GNEPHDPPCRYAGDPAVPWRNHGDRIAGHFDDFAIRFDRRRHLRVVKQQDILIDLPLPFENRAFLHFGIADDEILPPSIPVAAFFLRPARGGVVVAIISGRSESRYRSASASGGGKARTRIIDFVHLGSPEKGMERI